MHLTHLETVANSLVAPGKGILAADESNPTITKRFDTIGLKSTEENRRAYRETLFGTPSLNEFISGVILFEETLRQKNSRGVSLAEALTEQQIIPGIKVDKGVEPIPNFPEEKVTAGLDGLRERLAEYYQLGARFTKWRAVISIGEKVPTDFGRKMSARGLACFAALSQEAGMVPIVEPEVLMDGAHTIERCAEVTEEILHKVFYELREQRVRLEQMLLKPSMVISGEDCSEQAGIEDVAEKTLRCLRRTVPAAVPGVVFLSGGQSDALATAHLNAMNKLNHVPWQLSFSYGRALQAPALKIWKGAAANISAAQKALYHRAKCNSLARYGHYFAEMEKESEATRS
ncbi:MAG: fructose-bisphosphate aldolase class I [Verrucomicrobiota bacterium]|nr:fructose-bisphosphate aldolase class I [Verrucomicrobiota bacterium]